MNVGTIANTINQILDHHEFSNDFFDDFDDETSIQLNHCEVETIRYLNKTPEKRWSQKMIMNAIRIIDKYKSQLNDILDVEIDFSTLNLIKNDLKENEICNGIICCDKRIIMPNHFLSEKYNNVAKHDECSFSMPLNYSNVFHLIHNSIEKDFMIPSQSKNKINNFLNGLNYEDKPVEIAITNDDYDIDLLDFQEVGTLFGLLNKRIMIADEMGLGKTIQALSIISKLKSYPAFIICPKSLKYKWENECKKIKNVKTEIYSKKTCLKNIENKIYIFTYNDIPKIIDYIGHHKNIKAIIFDESHFLKNRNTLRSKSCLKLNKYPELIIELTGSPILNRVSEMAHQIEVLRKMNIFGNNIDFTNTYCKREKLYKREDMDEFDYEKDDETIKELSSIMKQNFYIRRLKKDTLKSLPEKRRDFIYIDINNRKEYNSILEQYKKERDLKNKKQLLEKLKQVAAEGKMASIKEQIDDFIENNEKVVVWAYHNKMQENLIALYPNALRITKNENDQERYENQNKFLYDKNEKIIICSIKIAHTGFDLFSSSHSIFTEMDWTPEINKQCEDKLHRIGQLNPVNLWYIIAKDTVEERIIEINKDKLKIINTINDNDENFFINQSRESIKKQVMDEL